MNVSLIVYRYARSPNNNFITTLQIGHYLLTQVILHITGFFNHQYGCNKLTI